MCMEGRQTSAASQDTRQQHVVAIMASHMQEEQRLRMTAAKTSSSDGQ